MMAKTTRDIGSEGEDFAAAFLRSKGWVILDRNYTYQKSEIDIIASDKGTVVFVEVKLRSNTSYGRPEEYVTPAKEKNIKKAAEAWLFEQNKEEEFVRFDIISVVPRRYDTPEIMHFRDAFR